jgi:hypothetical protein
VARAPRPTAARRPRLTKIAQGWPKLWAYFRARIGIFSQSVGPSLTIWASPVHFSLLVAAEAVRHTPYRHGLNPLSRTHLARRCQTWVDARFKPVRLTCAARQAAAHTHRSRCGGQTEGGPARHDRGPARTGQRDGEDGVGAQLLLAPAPLVLRPVQLLDLRRGRSEAGPKEAGWPTHSCGNTATEGSSRRST